MFWLYSIRTVLRVLHLDHVLEIKSPVQVALLLSFVITALFGIIWVVNLIQLRAHMLHVVGCPIFIWNALLSLEILINYDQNGDLYKQKEKVHQELKRQTQDMLVHARNQAGKLRNLLDETLKSELNRHIADMKAILYPDMKDCLHEDGNQRTFNKLVTCFADHLHQLRAPSLDHFKSLLEHAPRAQSAQLKKIMTSTDQQSMVQLLTRDDEQQPLALRTRTAPRGKLASDSIHGNDLPANATPADEVLLPMRKVMDWFTNSDLAPGMPEEVGATASKGGHICSTLRMRLMLGSAFSLAYLCMLLLSLMEDNSMIIWRIPNICSSCAMLFYLFANGLVMVDTEKLDAVLMMQDAIHKLEEFKWSVNQLNTHLFANTDKTISVVSDVKQCMDPRMNLISDFFRKTRNRMVCLAEYKDLAKNFRKDPHVLRERESALGGLLSFPSDGEDSPFLARAGGA